MERLDEMSNGQSWEIRVVCKNKQFLDAVVSAILSHGRIDFEVTTVDYLGKTDGRFVVLMCSCWFSNLRSISRRLAKIEKKLRGA